MEASDADPEFRSLFFHDNAAGLLGIDEMEDGK
jgi:hypothetical protein